LNSSINHGFQIFEFLGVDLITLPNRENSIPSARGIDRPLSGGFAFDEKFKAVLLGGTAYDSGIKEVNPTCQFHEARMGKLTKLFYSE